jgi:pre-rRNA-processing protein TSR1
VRTVLFALYKSNSGLGKVSSGSEERGKRRTPYQQAMSKLARKNQAKQLRINHKEKQDDDSRIFQGPSGAPKHVAIIPLSAEADVEGVIQKLNASVDTAPDTSGDGPIRVRVERFRRNLLYLPGRFDTFNAMDVCKLADWVLFVVSPAQEYNAKVDMLLKAVEGQGITNFAAIVQGLDDNVTASKRSRHLIDLRLALGRYLPTLDKMLSLDNTSDCANLVRSLCTASTKGVRWRDDRSWMMIEDAIWTQPDETTTSHTATITGVVRGRPLNPDRLVHLSGYGDFRIASVQQLSSQSHKRKADEMAMEETMAEWGPSAEQDNLDDYAPEIVDMADADVEPAHEEKKGVLLDDYHYFSDDNSHIPSKPKKLPRGTSDYQSAWYLEDVSDSDDDMSDAEHGDIEMASEPVLEPEDGFVAPQAMTEGAPTEYPESEMHVDVEEDEEARQLELYRSRKREAEEDLEFPDEIELPPTALARERLAKYRGLKSLRTSEWNTQEDKPYEPSEYPRLLQVADYKRSANTAKKEALTAPVPAGTRVSIVLVDVPEYYAAPASMFSLLRHEHKNSVINLSMTLFSTIETPVKSKDDLLVQIGHRRLVINPIFSASGNTPNDVHKFARFLHPGTTATATFTGPVTWGSVPVLVFRPRVSDDAAASDPLCITCDTLTQDLELVGTATTLPPSPTRVIAKRAILTGHPFKMHKKVVTIRYMFFNREDVAWFAALPLWTKRGRQGFIKEPLGTHGYFKATFDGKVNSMDAVGVSLYKRVWPRVARVVERL